MIHIDKINGYQIFAHNPKAEDISDAIREILTTKRSSIKIKLNHIEQDNVEEADFEKQCAEYFERNFESLAKEAPLILPCKEPEYFKEIVKTMEHWCRKTNKSSSIKGLVLHNFSILQHLKHFGFTREALKERLKIENFSEAPVVVVYNPQENVLLLSRIAENQDLATDIKRGLDDLKMFILMCNEKLKGSSNMKLISLVVTDKKVDLELECPNCMNNVLSMETFKDPATFENWWEDKTTQFENETVENINHKFIKSFLAKIIGAVAATFIYGKYIPTMTDKPDQQMANLAVFLTREQMEILHSYHKHIIIRGGFGCGKTIVAAAMLKKISENLKNDEKLYYICFNSRSEFLNQMTQTTEKKDTTNVTVFRNEEKRSLSVIIKGILEKNESGKKMNFVVDEYDGEDLDESKAERLNEIFIKSLKQSFILLIVQPIKKEREIDTFTIQKNRFELLETMKLYQLNWVMRNSVEIHNLVKLTVDVLGKQPTIFNYDEVNKVESEYKTYVDESGKNTTIESPNHGPDITPKVSSNQTDPDEYRKQKPSIPKLGLDEALANLTSAEAPNAESISGRKVIDLSIRTTIKSNFLFEKADRTGHKVSSRKPAFLEIGNRSDFQKILSLIAIFEERKITRSEHVVLHFDTATSVIPDIFLFAFTHHFNIKEKVTNKYEEFKSKEKSILVCSYPAFRGLEHPKITVVIDRDINYVQHYLVEALARCTTDLYIVILQNSSTLKQVTAEWKNKQAIRQWEVKISEDVTQQEDVKLDITRSTNTEIINANMKLNRNYYKKARKKICNFRN